MLTVFAEETGASTETAQTSFLASPWVTIIMLVAMVAIFYFLIIRPQKKQEKKTAEMRSAIKAGDEVVTIGGIIGTVVIVRDDKIMIETGNDKTKLTILKSSVREILNAEPEEK
ncbi:MAG: preprotein translocase subunit YajC [Clostridia bacterium]|nr:preprotein translocase subunit YajC [Clostridia bacterium]